MTEQLAKVSDHDFTILTIVVPNDGAAGKESNRKWLADAIIEALTADVIYNGLGNDMNFIALNAEGNKVMDSAKHTDDDPDWIDDGDVKDGDEKEDEWSEADRSRLEAYSMISVRRTLLGKLLLNGEASKSAYVKVHNKTKLQLIDWIITGDEPRVVDDNLDWTAKDLHGLRSPEGYLPPDFPFSTSSGLPRLIPEAERLAKEDDYPIVPVTSEEGRRRKGETDEEHVRRVTGKSAKELLDEQPSIIKDLLKDQVKGAEDEAARTNPTIKNDSC